MPAEGLHEPFTGVESGGGKEDSDNSVLLATNTTNRPAYGAHASVWQLGLLVSHRLLHSDAQGMHAAPILHITSPA